MPKHDTQREYHFPLQIIFALKEKNGGKLNSHLWLLMGVAQQLCVRRQAVARGQPHVQ